jgi:hypothetical protein
MAGGASSKVYVSFVVNISGSEDKDIAADLFRIVSPCS